MRFLIILILLFSSNVSFAGNKDYISEKWGEMVYNKEEPNTSTHKYIVDGKKKKMKWIDAGEAYYDYRACNILGSRKFFEKKTKKPIIDWHYVNMCTPCQTKQEAAVTIKGKKYKMAFCPYPELEVIHVYEHALITQFEPIIFDDAQPNSEGLVHSILNISSGSNETFELYKIMDDQVYFGVLRTFKTPFKQQQIKQKATEAIDDPEILTLVDSIMNRMGNVMEEKVNVLLSTKEINLLKSKIEFFPELNIQRRD